MYIEITEYVKMCGYETDIDFNLVDGDGGFVNPGPDPRNFDAGLLT